MIRHPGRVGLALTSVVTALLTTPSATVAHAAVPDASDALAHRAATAAKPHKPHGSHQGVHWGPTSWVSGVGGYSVRGRLAGPSRQVRLEYKIAHGWRVLARAKSHHHVFSLTGSWDWYGAHKVRLRSVGAKGHPAKVLGTKRFRVTPDYTPRGTKSQYVTMKDSGGGLQRLNPCRTIRWRFNSAGGAGDAYLGQIQEALTLISRASGLTFKYVGTSTTIPYNVKKLEHGTDMVIAFAHDADMPNFDATARGGPVRFAHTRKHSSSTFRIAQTGVSISLEQISDGYYSTDEVSTSPTTLLVFMHELGHAMGLNHATKPGSDVEVMWSGSTYIAPWPDGLNYPRWGAGDIAGLSKVGMASGCLH